MTKISMVENNRLLLTASEVAHMLSISVRTLWRMVEKNEIPQPIRYNRRLIRWQYDAVKSFVDSRK